MNHTRLPPGESNDLAIRIQRIVDFWKDLYDGGDSGGASWEELDGLQHEVVDCLAKQPPDVYRAESRTAYAMAIIANCELY
jgi:hypothetical protein